jgi:aspartyl-tRNA(Asn)/glutamyl-tRNA(Gln) amidotransferase subunit A
VSQPWELPIVEAALLLQEGGLSSYELTRSYLDRIETVDPFVRSYITVARDSAIAEAKAADREIARGLYRGSLHGVPIALKDVIDTAGLRTTAASRRFIDRVPATDAAVVSHLRQAGAVLLGKLNLYEFALGPPRNGDAFPATLNPWNLKHVPGGSSSGSGAAVAAGLCAAALGTDAGGSIRRPAAECGVVGLKPTAGAVSTRGVVSHTWSVDNVGPLARSVQDASIVYSVIAHANRPNDAAGRGSASEDLRGVTIGVPWTYVRSNVVQPEVEKRFDEALRTLHGLGADVVDVELPSSADFAATILNVIVFSEAFAYHGPHLLATASQYGLGLRERLLNGALFRSSDYINAQRARRRLSQDFHALLRQVDVLVTPTMPRTAPTLGEEMNVDSTLSHIPFTRFANLTGQPAISVPYGWDDAGLPIGVMLTCAVHRDRLALSVGSALEGSSPPARRPVQSGSGDVSPGT